MTKTELKIRVNNISKRMVKELERSLLIASSRGVVISTSKEVNYKYDFYSFSETQDKTSKTLIVLSSNSFTDNEDYEDLMIYPTISIDIPYSKEIPDGEYKIKLEYIEANMELNSKDVNYVFKYDGKEWVTKEVDLYK